MPDADGRFRGIALTGRAAASWERIFGETQPPRENLQDTSCHDRLLARSLEDEEFRAEFECQQREIAAFDTIVRASDSATSPSRPDIVGDG